MMKDTLAFRFKDTLRLLMLKHESAEMKGMDTL
jgi:hypothetical protein